MSISSKLAQYTSCDVSDALVNFGVDNGGFVPNLIQRSADRNGKKMGYNSVVGTAYTVLYAPKSDSRPALDRAYIDEIPNGSVLVIALTADQQTQSAPFVLVDNALYGGLMSTGAQYRGAAGSVILGRIRDLAEHRDLGYPVWSFGLGTTAPGPVVKVVGINVSVSVKITGVYGADSGDMTINPGDYVVADENGVVRIPVGHDSGPESDVDIEKVLEYIPKRVEADTRVSEDMKNGRGAAEAQKFWRGKICSS